MINTGIARYKNLRMIARDKRAIATYMRIGVKYFMLIFEFSKLVNSKHIYK
jgi:hypothetical protein